MPEPQAPNPATRSIVLTVLGPDRPGLVDRLATALADHGGNWLESRMARLAGQFAGVVHASVGPDAVDGLRAALDTLAGDGLTVTLHADAEPAAPADRPVALRLELMGHDRPGIVRDVSHALAGAGVNVIDLTTGVASAPMTGEPMFRAAAELNAPGDADLDALRDALDDIADRLDLDLTLADG